MTNNINFEKANLTHKDTIFEWLDKPHVREFWDNSPEHREDIVIFMKGRKVKSPYFDNKYVIDYWIGYINNESFCFLLTSKALVEEEVNELKKQHFSKTGETYYIDFCIGNEKYLGIGLAAPTLEDFTKFFQTNIDNKADTFFIDPDENNPRAKHVYEKAGFKQVGEFVMENRAFEGHNTYLMVKRL